MLWPLGTISHCLWLYWCTWERDKRVALLASAMWAVLLYLVHMREQGQTKQKKTASVITFCKWVLSLMLQRLRVMTSDNGIEPSVLKCDTMFWTLTVKFHLVNKQKVDMNATQRHLLRKYDNSVLHRTITLYFFLNSNSDTSWITIYVLRHGTKNS